MKLPTKEALIIILLWAFAPLAWFLMWQDKKYHSWFPKLLWVNGIIFTVIFTTQSFVFIPKLMSIYEALGITMPEFLTPLLFVIVMVFVVLQIPVGFYLQRKAKHNKRLTETLVIPLLIVFAIDGVFAFSTGLVSAIQSPSALIEEYIESTTSTGSIKELPLPNPTPEIGIEEEPQKTPTTLTFSELNKKYGPCVVAPVLMYHHIGDLERAKKLGRLGLTVSTEYFREHMKTLKDKGYNTLHMSRLTEFFENGRQLPSKSVFVTIDDGYDDFYYFAYPILKEMNIPSTMFLPTGLVGNREYLTWEQIQEMNNSGIVLFANHTWSHASLGSRKTDIVQEISFADRDLRERALGNPSVFAYPYGTVGETSEGALEQLGYKIAFTTKSGSTLCKKQALTLPRVRVGNRSLSTYGF